MPSGARVWLGLNRVVTENGRGRTVLIFTSGGLISAALQLFISLSDESTLRLAGMIADSSATKFLYNGECMTLAVFNHTEQLALLRDAALVTYR